METESERDAEHFARGRAVGEQITAATSDPGEVFRLALIALNTAELPMVQATGGEVALLAGITVACSEWLGLQRLADGIVPADQRPRACGHGRGDSRTH